MLGVYLLAYTSSWECWRQCSVQCPVCLAGLGWAGLTRLSRLWPAAGDNSNKVTSWPAQLVARLADTAPDYISISAPSATVTRDLARRQPGGSQVAAGADNCLFSAEPRDIVITRSPPLHRIPTLLLALYTLPNPVHTRQGLPSLQMFKLAKCGNNLDCMHIHHWQCEYTIGMLNADDE